MKWIGLTGGIASGKSTVSNKLKEQSIPVIDADEIAKDIVKKGTPGLKSLTQNFGEDILLPDGSLNRRKLGRLVFGNKDMILGLEAITHPLIREEVQKIKKSLQNRGEKIAIYDIPLLFETHSEDQFDAIILVTCTEEQQRQRLLSRSVAEGQPLTLDEVNQRIAAQIPLSVKEGKSDFVFWNNQDEKNIQKEMQRLACWLDAQVLSPV